MKMKVELELDVMDFKYLSPIQINIKEGLEATLEVRTHTCPTHGEHSFVEIPILAVHRAHSIESGILELEDDFDSVEVIDYFYLAGAALISFDEKNEVEMIQAGFNHIYRTLEENGEFSPMEIWKEIDDDLQVSVLEQHEDQEDFQTGVTDYLTEHPEIIEAAKATWIRHKLAKQEVGNDTRH